MKWHILAVGKPALSYAKAGVDEYLGRLTRIVPAKVDYLREQGSDQNGARQLERSERAYRFVLDERGDHLTSSELADLVGKLEMDRCKEVAVLIGGADGHCSEVREKADRTICLSQFTLQHELALVVWLEQLYRAYTIKRGEPYHR